MIRASPIFAGLLVAIFALAGCDVFDPGLLDAAADAEMDAADAGGGACVLRHPPPPPSASDGPDVEEVLFAIRDPLLDQGRGVWRSTGFDVDDICTRTPDLQTECLPPSGGSIEVDGEGGLDNSLGHNILPLVNISLAEPGETFQEGQREVSTTGRGVILVRLRGWNGTADDPEIDVAFAQSVAGAAAAEDGSAPEAEIIESEPIGPDGEILERPRWDGTDWFWAREDSFVGGNPELPRVRDEDAYMTDGTLVMRFEEQTDIIFSGRKTGVIIRLRDFDVTIELSDDLMQVERLTAGGRWAIEDIVATAEKAGVCRGDTAYGVLLAALEENADVMVEPGTGGPDAMCDALSAGMAWESGVRANIAGTAQPRELEGVCDTMDGGVPDAGTADAGTADAGTADAGTAERPVDGG